MLHCFSLAELWLRLGEAFIQEAMPCESCCGSRCLIATMTHLMSHGINFRNQRMRACLQLFLSCVLNKTGPVYVYWYMWAQVKCVSSSWTTKIQTALNYFCLFCFNHLVHCHSQYCTSFKCNNLVERDISQSPRSLCNCHTNNLHDNRTNSICQWRPCDVVLDKGSKWTFSVDC